MDDDRPKAGEEIKYADKHGVVKAVTNQYMIFDNSKNGDYDEYALALKKDTDHMMDYVDVVGTLDAMYIEGWYSGDEE